MSLTVILDSGPLGLLVHQQSAVPVTECRAWLRRHLDNGTRFVVPAIVAYELRRELLRLNHRRSIRLLDDFIAAEPDRYIPLTEPQLRDAAQLWADLRRRGRSLADPQALDIDVILAAQSLSLGLKPDEFCVATTNPAHLGQLVPAKNWQEI